MARRVAWSPRALADLEAIAEYIATDSNAYAKAVVKRITDQTRSLRLFPHLGRKVPEFDDEGMRELLAYSFRIIYRVDRGEVTIAAIIHGKRDLNV